MQLADSRFLIECALIGRFAVCYVKAWKELRLDRSCLGGARTRKRRLDHLANQKRNNFEARSGPDFPAHHLCFPSVPAPPRAWKSLLDNSNRLAHSSLACLSTFIYLCFSSRASPAKVFCS